MLIRFTLNKHFRLWLTTELTDQLPGKLLDTCVRFTMEPPRGVRPRPAGKFPPHPSPAPQPGTPMSPVHGVTIC